LVSGAAAPAQPFRYAQRFCQEQARIGCGRSPTNSCRAKEETGRLPPPSRKQTARLATKRKRNRSPKTFKSHAQELQTIFKQISNSLQRSSNVCQHFL
jgi:hypothetical protein